ncbi:MAG: class II aldolase/adducin family protein [Thermoplasmatales archaeon]|nr:class II aldolase/adducin family protein [Thermoplasmatales archaeon]
MTEREARSELAGVCSRLYERRLTFSAGGNVSVRVGDAVLITPSGRNKGSLAPGDMVLVGMDGVPLSGGRPSIETGFHIALYRKRKDVNAVVHCHPPWSTALSVTGGKIEPYTPEGALLLGNVAVIPYHMPGSGALVEAVAAASGSDAMLMAHHGALTQGSDLEEAYNRMEELELQAFLQHLCKGSPPMGPDDIAAVRRAYP